MENYNDDDQVLREPIAPYGKKAYSIQEYLDFENSSPEKHEYYNGEIFAMAGASDNHAAIETNLIISLGNALKKSPCKPWVSSKRLHIPSNTLFTYPDITIACRDELPKSETGATLPKVIIEVLSKSTRKYDRGEKFELYKDIPGLQEYILVDSEQFAIDIYRKNAENNWELEQYETQDRSIKIKALDISLSFKKIYESVQIKEKTGKLSPI